MAQHCIIDAAEAAVETSRDRSVPLSEPVQLLFDTLLGRGRGPNMPLGLDRHDEEEPKRTK